MPPCPRHHKNHHKSENDIAAGDGDAREQTDAVPPRVYHILQNDQEQRIDKVLATTWPDLSRARLIRLIKAGELTGGGAIITEPKTRLPVGTEVTLTVPAAVPAKPRPEAIALEILFEDSHLLVLNKPAGMVVHPAAGHDTGTLVNALLHHCGEGLSGIGGVKRPGIVHRLDKDTSGLMVVAKSDPAHQGLARQFAEEKAELDRVYHALVRGVPCPEKGEITGNIGRDPRNRKRMTLLRKGGKYARTLYEVLRSRPDRLASFIRCRLTTGRTHQIRVHLSQNGHAVLGDPVYGSRRPYAGLKQLSAETRSAIFNFDRQLLHAATLGFTHPVTQTPMRFRSDLPDDMAEALRALALSPPKPD